MIKIKHIIIFSFIYCLTSFAQRNDSPKLVVGIVVDQMRYDYLEKYYEDFGDNGFKKLIQEGTSFTNCKINYIPTVTAAGHASIYTGTVPYFNGIIANDWIDRKSGEKINACTAINPPNKIFPNSISTDYSPEQLLSTTIGEQIKLDNYGKSKVISISLKDRGAIMPAGRGADAAYWYNDKTGKFVTSYYYMDILPEWLINFNNSGKIESYLNQEWDLLKSAKIYQELPADNSPYETDVFNEGRTSFPHNLKNVSEEERYKKLVHTPWGNQILVDLAKEILRNEKLGKGKFTDHLAISFSSTDKIGHDYGPQSYEVKDTYLRLDKQIADLLNLLDNHIGKENYILFLTADHGGMENTQHLLDMKYDAGVLESTNFYNDLLSFVRKRFGTSKIIQNRFSRNLYLNYDLIDSLSLEREKVEEDIKFYLNNNVPEITEVYTRTELEKLSASRNSANYILNGFNKSRSGDILYSLKTFYLIWEKKYGAQHGSRHEYDNHIPLIFYGDNIPTDSRNEEVFIVDIAATVCNLIGITKPSDSIGIPLLKSE